MIGLHYGLELGGGDRELSQRIAALESVLIATGRRNTCVFEATLMLLACAMSEQPRKCWPASRSLKPELRSAFAQGYGGRSSLRSSLRFKRRLERVKGIEPSCAAWEAAVLPLNYTRGGIFDFRLPMIIGSPKEFKSS